MREAYVLVTTNVGAEHTVMKEIKTVPGVVEAYTILGVYDLIIRVQADSLEELKDIVKVKIRKLENIRSTLTMILI